MAFLRASLAGLAAWLSLIPLAYACSTDGRYVPPSGFELVEMADAIVVATAIDGTKVTYDQETHVRFRVDSVLKGEPPRAFDSEGYGLIDPGNKNDREFHGGMCGRSGFTRGHTYVLALRKTQDGDGWREANYTFAPSSEDYTGPNDPWVKTIRDFLDIQKRFAASEQYEELKRFADQLRKQRKSDALQNEIDEIERHLSIRSAFKPTWYLVDTYEQLEQGTALYWPWAARDYWEPDSTPPPIDEQKQLALYYLNEGNHPDAAPLFERLLAKPNPAAFELASAVIFVANSGDLRRSFEIISTRIAPTLAVRSFQEVLLLVSASAQAMDSDWPPRNLSWKDDPYLVARWPIVAFGFSRYLEQVGGSDWAPSFFDEFEALRPRSFEDWPEWTLIKSRYNDEIGDWALAKLKDETLITDYAKAVAAWDAQSFTPPPEDPATLPMRVMIRSSYSALRAEALEQAFCQSPERRRLLINLLGAEAQPIYDGALFKRMLATPTLTADERALTSVSLAELLGKIQALRRMGPVGSASDYDLWQELLAISISGERPNIEPISCRAR